MGVAGAEGPGLGLHPLGGDPPAAVELGQDVHGVVARVEEDPAPQIGDPVGAALGDPDQAAAGSDAPKLRLADGVPDARRQPGQHGEGEQGLEGAGRRQLAVRVVGGEHLPRTGVGHQPGPCGELRKASHSGARADLGAGSVQQRGVRGGGPRPTRRSGLRPTGVGHRRGRQRQQPRHAERTGRHGHPGRESDDHTINVGTEMLREATTGPHSTR
ncbi:hypothetical protein GCM10017668_64700 [Streptomyces tuirus]|uniref:Uncharacterized protein n=1 Tax=Streptomyces tuirus TaxID=68278 RepID=A0A7G1NSM6_9ACTN|nr:hypothetical protein GCM10017668_64700 [Streptomyces tuirus]